MELLETQSEADIRGAWPIASEVIVLTDKIQDKQLQSVLYTDMY